MKKVIGGAVVALSLITLAACTEEAKAEGNALTVNPFVGAEHAMDANTNTGTVGADIVAGDLTVTASADLSLNADANGDRFGTELVEIDFSYAVSDKTSIYMENDLNDSFVKSETIVGVKHYF